MFRKYLIFLAAALWMAACNDSGTDEPVAPATDTTTNPDTLHPPAPVLLGDYAPLQIGNVWVYKGSTSGKIYCNSMASTSLRTRTVTLLSRRESSDTLFFRFSVVDSTFASRSFPRVFDTVFVGIRTDSVAQLQDGTLGLNSGYIRYFDSHLVWVTAATGQLMVAGKSRYAYTVAVDSLVTGQGPYSRSLTYAQNVGMIRYATHTSLGCGFSSETDTLFRFIPAPADSTTP